MITKQTVTEARTPDGRPAWRVTCRCSTHPDGMDTAIVLGPLDGSPYPDANVHGAVLLAHHPALGPVQTRRGRSWPA